MLVMMNAYFTEIIKYDVSQSNHQSVVVHWLFKGLVTMLISY